MILLPLEKYNHLMKPVKKETIQPKFEEEKQIQNNVETKAKKKIFTVRRPRGEKVVLKKGAMTFKRREKSRVVEKVVLKKKTVAAHSARDLPLPEKKVVVKKSVVTPREKKVVLKKGVMRSKTHEKSPLVEKVEIGRTSCRERVCQYV